MDDSTQRRRQVFTGLTLDLGLRMERMYIDWLTNTLMIVRSLASRAKFPR